MFFFYEHFLDDVNYFLEEVSVLDLLGFHCAIRLKVFALLAYGKGAGILERLGHLEPILASVVRLLILLSLNVRFPVGPELQLPQVVFDALKI